MEEVVCTAVTEGTGLKWKISVVNSNRNDKQSIAEELHVIWKSRVTDRGSDWNELRMGELKKGC